MPIAVDIILRAPAEVRRLLAAMYIEIPESMDLSTAKEMQKGLIQ
jgi:hypothetical protein